MAALNSCCRECKGTKGSNIHYLAKLDSKSLLRLDLWDWFCKCLEKGKLESTAWRTSSLRWRRYVLVWCMEGHKTGRKPTGGTWEGTNLFIRQCWVSLCCLLLVAKGGRSLESGKVVCRILVLETQRGRSIDLESIDNSTHTYITSKEQIYLAVTLFISVTELEAMLVCMYTCVGMFIKLNVSFWDDCRFSCSCKK